MLEISKYRNGGYYGFDVVMGSWSRDISIYAALGWHSVVIALNFLPCHKMMGSSSNACQTIMGYIFVFLLTLR